MYYYYDYGTQNYGGSSALSSGAIFMIVFGVAALIGLVLFFTLFKKSNEGRYQGKKGKIYNFFNFNKFYTEDLIRLLYIMCALGLLASGIYCMIAGKILPGLIIAIGGNIVLRLTSELIIALMVMTRRVVSADRKLSRIEKFYGDDYSDWEDSPCGAGEEAGSDEYGQSDEAPTLNGLDELEDFECSGYCDSCASACTPEFKEEHEIRDEAEAKAETEAEAEAETETESETEETKNEDTEADETEDSKDVIYL